MLTDADFLVGQVAVGGTDVLHDLATLREAGVAVLNVAWQNDPPIAGTGIPYAKVPLADSRSNSVGLFRAACAVLDAMVARYNRVVVVCNSGESRSVAVVCTWLVSHRFAEDWPAAVEMVRAKRPKAKPTRGLIESIQPFVSKAVYVERA